MKLKKIYYMSAENVAEVGFDEHFLFFFETEILNVHVEEPLDYWVANLDASFNETLTMIEKDKLNGYYQQVDLATVFKVLDPYPFLTHVNEKFRELAKEYLNEKR